MWNEHSNQWNEERVDERPRREEEPFSRRTPAGQTLEQPLRHDLIGEGRRDEIRVFSRLRSVSGTEPRIRPARVSLRKLERWMVGRRWVFVQLPV